MVVFLFILFHNNFNNKVYKQLGESSMRILVVEDDKGTARFIKKGLSYH